MWRKTALVRTRRVKPDVYAQMTDILLEVERHLRELSLWADAPPPAERLISTEPFCVDTLSFPEWLQFIFLPRMSAIIAAQMPLPSKSQIATMAEEYFRGLAVDSSKLHEVLLRFDQWISLGVYD